MPDDKINLILSSMRVSRHLKGLGARYIFGECLREWKREILDEGREWAWGAGRRSRGRWTGERMTGGAVARPQEKNQGARGIDQRGLGRGRWENGAKPLHASRTPTGNSWTDERVGTDEIDSPPVGIGLWHRWVSLLRRGSASLAVNKTTNEVSVSNKKRRLIASVWYSLNSCIYSGIACTVERDRLPAYVLGGVDV